MNKFILQVTLPPSFIPHVRAKLSDGTIVENNTSDSIIAKFAPKEDSIVLFSFEKTTPETNEAILMKVNYLARIRTYDAVKYNCINFVEELFGIEVTKNIILFASAGLGLFGVYKILKARQA